jgi:hypothetical protein
MDDATNDDVVPLHLPPSISLVDAMTRGRRDGVTMMQPRTTQMCLRLLYSIYKSSLSYIVLCSIGDYLYSTCKNSVCYIVLCSKASCNIYYKALCRLLSNAGC